MSRTLHGLCDSALALGASAGLATRINLSAIGDELAQTGDILVVELVFVAGAAALKTNTADFAAAAIAPESWFVLARFPLRARRGLFCRHESPFSRRGLHQ